jgi:hypothetical protein
MKFNFYLGSAISAWLLAAMVIASELFPPFKDLLKSIFTHHWIGKTVIVLLVFLAASWLMKDKKSLAGVKDKDAGFYSVVGSLAAILLFFIIEFIL